MINSSTLTTRDGSVVDNVNAAPTTIAGCSDASLTVRVYHTRILNLLSLFQERGLRGNQINEFGRACEFANLSVQTFVEHKNSIGGHGLI